MIIAIIVVVLLVVVMAVALISAKNTFARQENIATESWAGIDLELMRRHDTIGMSTQLLSGMFRGEQNVFNQLAQARTQAMQARMQGPMMSSQAEATLNGALQNFFQVAENYPELKSMDAYMQLFDTIADSNDRITAAQRIYNSNVREYNTRFDTFPTSLMAGGHQKKQLFEILDQRMRQAPDMSGLMDVSNSAPVLNGYPQQQQFPSQPQGYPQQQQFLPQPQQQQFPPQQQAYPQQPQQQLYPQQGYPQQQPQGYPQQQQPQYPQQGYPQQYPQQQQYPHQ